MTAAYCENGECRVILYAVPDKVHAASDHFNCPGCGRFGRLKDEPKKAHPDMPQSQDPPVPGMGGYGVID